MTTTTTKQGDEQDEKWRLSKLQDVSPFVVTVRIVSDFFFDYFLVVNDFLIQDFAFID